MKNQPTCRAFSHLLSTVVLALCLSACESPPTQQPSAPKPRASGSVRPEVLIDLETRRARAAEYLDQHPPYSPDVAAVFADPTLSYNTPALEPERKTYTTQAELATFIKDITRWSQQSSGRHAVHVQRLALGFSQGGVPIEALRFSKKSPSAVELKKPQKARHQARRLNASSARTAPQPSSKPVALLIGEQHGDEPAGAEALMVLSQQVANGPLTSVLDRLDVVIVPRLNPDGAARARHKTLGGINLNHDHMLLRTPEARALAQLAQDLRPVLFVDLHEYTVPGTTLDALQAIQRFDALIQHATAPQVPELINRAANEWFHPALVKDLQRAGLSSEWYHTFTHEKGSFKAVMGSSEPDNARNAFGLRNTISFQIESRGAGLGRWHLKRRIHTHVIATSSLLRLAARRAHDLVRLRRFVDHQVSKQACKGQAVIEALPTSSERQLVMLDPNTGTDKIVTVLWDSSLVLEPSQVVARPCGYRLDAQQTKAVQNLRALGLRVQHIESKAQHQDHFYVSLDQPWANLAMATLEPGLSSSYAVHGIVKTTEGIQRVMTVAKLIDLHRRASKRAAR